MRTLIRTADLLGFAFLVSQQVLAQSLAVTGQASDTKDSSGPSGAVDLGIVMTRRDGTTYNLYWAKSNLSTGGLCANPWDYGDYYAWGETEPNIKSEYDRLSYKWFSGPVNKPTVLKYNYMSSYGVVDNIRVLQRGEKPGETIDDAARAKLGGKWRMPTFDEWKALESKCKWTWIKNYKGTGVNGYVVTSSNGNSIFLPAAGRRQGVNLYYAGSYGSYWSSSLGSPSFPHEPYSPQFSPTSAQSINFSSEGVYLYDIIERSFGFSVRPVIENSEGSISDGLLAKANKGDARAQYQLGERYENEENNTEALKWYRKSAEQGYDAAQNILGVVYQHGDFGVSQDYLEAVKWYRKAAEQGNTDSQVSLGLLYGDGGGAPQVPQDYSEAVKWFRKAAEGGDDDGQLFLAWYYDQGKGVTQNYTEAVKWYRKSAEQGNKTAQLRLGVCYDNGYGVTKDTSEAVKWYRKAAEKGSAVAQYKLGLCYQRGFGVAQDNNEAIKWYKKAADNGNNNAKKALESLQ